MLDYRCHTVIVLYVLKWYIIKKQQKFKFVIYYQEKYLKYQKKTWKVQKQNSGYLCHF